MQQLVSKSKEEYIKNMMKKLKLVDIREQYLDLINEAEPLLFYPPLLNMVFSSL